MIVSSLDDLTDFLSRWYGGADLSFPSVAIHPDVIVPETLRQTWLQIGGLSVGYDDWLRTGKRSPLACQDGLVAPGALNVRNGIAQVVSENQGNWSIGYKDGIEMVDPPVYSDFLEQEIGGVGFIPLGCNLSELIITSVLTETIFFGALPEADVEEFSAECNHAIWTGHYYNAVGQGETYETPSHQIRTNHDGNLLGLYWEGKFSGFLASSSKGRERLGSLLNDTITFGEKHSMSASSH